MNVLSIGNSFSQDATRYLHKIAKADGVNLTSINIHIGGCSLFRHFKNMKGNRDDYNLAMNGEDTCFMVTMKEALISREWDVVTIQQVSQCSPKYETFTPYLSELCAYIREHAPKAKIYLQQTWAYENGSKRLCEELCYETHEQMFSDIEASYKKAAEEIKADGIIPSGEMFESLLHNGIEKVHRDTFHASLGLGRYALGLLWYKVLTGNSVLNNSFCDFDEPVSERDIKIIKTCVEKF